ncbi:LysE family translocator [Dongia sp.]|uniref:LysE family translocator n=1 Tax=Dongia sp. TaxID=1977262 RepID=UPI0037514E4B
MTPTLAVLPISGAIAVGAASPGPSFVMVMRTALARSRSDGVAAAFGMGIGGVVFCSLALLGMRAVFAQAPWLYLGFKVAGGGYLLYLAWRMWMGAKQPFVAEAGAAARPQLLKSFLLGLATQLSNPKTLIFYGSVFALLPANLPLWSTLALPAIIMAIETGWYMIVALVFSLQRPRAAYLRWKTWVDRCAAGVMGGLGLKLIFSSAKA